MGSTHEFDLLRDGDLSSSLFATVEDKAPVSALSSLGPQRHGDPPLLRRLRLHQSWYRAEVKGLARWGHTSPPRARELGSILAQPDADAGHNFESEAAREAFRERRTQGWGVEPVRCQAYMTSSQALTLNLLGPLIHDPRRMATFLTALGAAPPTATVNQSRIEFASARPIDHLNDRTIMDGYVELSAADGVRGVGIETKLADPFSSRKLGILARPSYLATNERLGLWEPSSNDWDHRIEQLARVHMLASSLSDRAAALLVIHHPLDTRTPEVVEIYRSQLVHPAQAIAVSLADAITALAKAGLTATAVERLRLRYIDFSASQGSLVRPS